MTRRKTKTSPRAGRRRKRDPRPAQPPAAVPAGDESHDDPTAADQQAMELAWADVAAEALFSAANENRQLNLVRLAAGRNIKAGSITSQSWADWTAAVDGLTEDQRDTLHAAACDPHKSAEQVRVLLAMWGVQVSLNAARAFRRMVRGIGTTTARTAARARAALAVQRAIGATTTVNAIAAHVESQLLMEVSSLVQAEPDGDFDPRRWEQIGKAVYQAGRNRREIERAGATGSARTSARGAGRTVDEMRRRTNLPAVGTAVDSQGLPVTAPGRVGASGNRPMRRDSTGDGVGTLPAG